MANLDLSNWGTAEEIINIAKTGDLIEFGRFGYRHWAVYVGDGKVIHVYLPSKAEKTATIKRERLQDVCKQDQQCRINNQTEKAKNRGLCALPQAQIVKNAQDFLGHEMSYNLLGNNCEFFATSCRYGEAFCHQVDSKADFLTSTAKYSAWTTAVAAGCAIVAGTMSYILTSPQKRTDRVYENRKLDNKNSL